MAIKQIVPIEITLVGDGTSTVFTLPLANMYQNGAGSTLPVGGVGVVPSSIAVSNTPVAVTSATVDSFGNITITLTTALANNVQATMEVDLFYSSGAITSSSTTPSQTVLVGGSVTVAQGTAANLNASSRTQDGLGNAIGSENMSSVNWLNVNTTSSVASGTTAPGEFEFVGGKSNDGTPQYQPIPLGTTGRSIIIEGFSGATAVGSNITQISGTTATAATFGTTASGTGLLTNASLFIGTTVAVAAASGIQKVGISGNAGASVDQVVGSAVPANALQIGASDGTNLQVLNTTVKSTQGARGLAVQELKDSGRSTWTMSATAAAGVTSETLLSCTTNIAGTTTASVTSYVIPSGKTLRIQNISYSVRAAAAAVPFCRITLRSLTSGATTATSPILWQGPEVFGIAATSGVGGQESCDFPDGMEIYGNGTITLGISHNDQATTNIINFTMTGFLY